MITNNTGVVIWTSDKGAGVINSEVDNGTSIIQAGAVYWPNICTNNAAGGWYTVTGANNVRGFTIQ